MISETPRLQGQPYKQSMRTQHGAWRVMLCAVFSLLLLSSCSKQNEHIFQYSIMGTYLRITVRGIEGQDAQMAADKAFHEIQVVDSLMSIFRLTSDFSRINLAAGVDTIRVSPITHDLLRNSEQFSKLTGSAFDISVGPLMRLWKLRGGGYLPKQAEIDSTLSLVGLDQVYLDPLRRRVYLPKGMFLDSGGIAKGYAVDLARKAVQDAGVSRGMIDLGGNLALIGPGPSPAGYWRIGLRNPVERNSTACTLELRDVAIATSGQYEQYFVRDGKRYGHLLNPRTGMPADSVLSVTIITPDALGADALSTGVFVLGPRRGMALVEELPDVEAIMILDPGPGNPLTQACVLTSSGMVDRIRWDLPSSSRPSSE